LTRAVLVVVIDSSCRIRFTVQYCLCFLPFALLGFWSNRSACPLVLLPCPQLCFYTFIFLVKILLLYLQVGGWLEWKGRQNTLHYTKIRSEMVGIGVHFVCLGVSYGQHNEVEIFLPVKHQMGYSNGKGWH